MFKISSSMVLISEKNEDCWVYNRSVWRTSVPAAVRHSFGRRVSAAVAYLPQETVIGSRGRRGVADSVG